MQITITINYIFMNNIYLYIPSPTPPMASRHAADLRGMAAFAGPGWLFFLCFFRIFFQQRFNRFFFDFWRVLEARMAPEIDFSTIFSDVFSHPRFISIFCSLFLFFSMLETLKTVLPCRRELNFGCFAFLMFDWKVHRKWVRKIKDFETENPGKS